MFKNKPYSDSLTDSELHTLVQRALAGEPVEPIRCCACSSEQTARVVDGGFKKPVCGQHARKYAREGYTVLPLLPLSSEGA